VSISFPQQLSRRRLIATAGACAAAGAMSGIRPAKADIALPAAYFPQGGTGLDEAFNCGPATVAAAINYSGVAFPTVMDVRATLGFGGPTDIGQWSWLLDMYGVPWYPTWSKPEMDYAISAGYVIVVAAWMADFSTAPDFEEAWSPFWGQTGRYDSFGEGHAMLVTGSAEGELNYLVHDPNVFPTEATSFYGDGAPKGAFRRYNAWELWNTVATYASGMALAVAPPPLKEEAVVKRVLAEQSDSFTGPGGGHTPERGVRLQTGLVVPPSRRGVISAVSEDEQPTVE
jgi:hypothetical protein